MTTPRADIAAVLRARQILEHAELELGEKLEGLGLAMEALNAAGKARRESRQGQVAKAQERAEQLADPGARKAAAAEWYSLAMDEYRSPPNAPTDQRVALMIVADRQDREAERLIRSQPRPEDPSPGEGFGRWFVHMGAATASEQQAQEHFERTFRFPTEQRRRLLMALDQDEEAVRLCERRFAWRVNDWRALGRPGGDRIKDARKGRDPLRKALARLEDLYTEETVTNPRPRWELANAIEHARLAVARLDACLKECRSLNGKSPQPMLDAIARSAADEFPDAPARAAALDSALRASVGAPVPTTPEGAKAAIRRRRRKRV